MMTSLNTSQLKNKFATWCNAEDYGLTRLLFIRGLGFITFIVFLIIFNQSMGLWGNNGLAPISQFTLQIESSYHNKLQSLIELPSLFYFLNPDQAMPIMGIIGLLIGILMMAGFANSMLLLTLWSLQLSFVNSGQIFYGFGWETLYLEIIFISLFIVPFWKWNLKTSTTPVSHIAALGLRWTLFRLMLGAGIIKIKSDPCWRDLTCLAYHFETQPLPHFLSFFFHHMPDWMQKAGVLFNHFIELVVPFFLFGTKRFRHSAGLLIALFQLILISSGNLAWFNWLTLLLVIFCFNDAFWQQILKIQWQKPNYLNSRARQLTTLTFFTGLLLLSFEPTANFFKNHPAMNTSYNRFHLINSYGAFGAIGKTRPEIIILGSEDNENWKEYKYKCAPVDIDKSPCWVTPYYFHLDWQLWFSAMHSQVDEQWLVNLAVRLLQNDTTITAMFAENPFENKAPRFLKMDLYLYKFAPLEKWPHQWWTREFVKPFLQPVSLQP